MRDRTKNPQECPRLWRLGLGSAEDLVLSKNGSSLMSPALPRVLFFEKGAVAATFRRVIEATK